jgi:hypothetical protein
LPEVQKFAFPAEAKSKPIKKGKQNKDPVPAPYRKSNGNIANANSAAFACEVW